MIHYFTATCISRFVCRLTSSQGYAFLKSGRSSRRHVVTISSVRLTQEKKFEVEQKWREHVLRGIREPNDEDPKKSYVLAMFPYPSGALHMGHVRVYTLSDAMARFQQLRGESPLHPMGWDSFGLPAENAARDAGVAPDNWTQRNITAMRQQLDELGFCFHWSREISTCEPNYFKWTQHIFQLLLKRHLAYRALAAVWWDPVDKTVLANEQVDSEGRSWRSGAVAERRHLRQWFIRTSAYSQQLVSALEDIDRESWKHVLADQRHWIGKCDGTRLEFSLRTPNGDPLSDRLEVFTNEPELICGLSRIHVSDSHWLAKQPGVVAVHPLTGAHIDIRVVPQLQGEFSRNESVLVLDEESVLEEDGDTLRNSGPLSGKSRTEARGLVLRHAREHHYGGYECSERLQDWLVSRQRSWGTPVPVCHCSACGMVPLPLPVLSTDPVEVKCPSCGGAATRDPDTLDTFMDSSWYFLRYCDPNNEKELCSQHLAFPVDIYVGGKEHAIMHLYFARFIAHFLSGEKIISFREPFRRLLTQGMVQAETWRDAEGKFYPGREVNSVSMRTLSDNTPVKKSWEKMSKSKLNGITPSEFISRWGVDTTRLALLSNVAPKSHRRLAEDAFVGAASFQQRLWALVHESASSEPPTSADLSTWEQSSCDIGNSSIRKVTHHLSTTFLLNTAISALHTFSIGLRRTPADARGAEFHRAVRHLLIMCSPLIPHLAEELWAVIQADNSLVTEQTWPLLDPDYLLPVGVFRGKKEVVSLQVRVADFDALTADSVQQMATVQLSEQYPDNVLTIHDFRLEVLYKAYLHIGVDGK